MGITSNIMKLLNVCQTQVMAAFQSRKHINVGQLPLPELPLWQRYHAESHLVFLQKFYELHLKL